MRQGVHVKAGAVLAPEHEALWRVDGVMVRGDGLRHAARRAAVIRAKIDVHRAAARGAVIDAVGGRFWIEFGGVLRADGLDRAAAQVEREQIVIASDAPGEVQLAAVGAVARAAHLVEGLLRQRKARAARPQRYLRRACAIERVEHRGAGCRHRRCRRRRVRSARCRHRCPRAATRAGAPACRPSWSRRPGSGSRSAAGTRKEVRSRADLRAAARRGYPGCWARRSTRSRATRRSARDRASGARSP